MVTFLLIATFSSFVAFPVDLGADNEVLFIQNGSLFLTLVEDYCTIIEASNATFIDLPLRHCSSTRVVVREISGSPNHQPATFAEVEVTLKPARYLQDDTEFDAARLHIGFRNTKEAKDVLNRLREAVQAFPSSQPPKFVSSGQLTIQNDFMDCIGSEASKKDTGTPEANDECRQGKLRSVSRKNRSRMKDRMRAAVSVQSCFQSFYSTGLTALFGFKHRAGLI